MSPTKGFFQAVLYLAAGIPRLGIVVAAADTLLFDGTGGSVNPWEPITRMPFGVTGALLLIAGVAVLGPLSEEVLFRGFLCPRLLSQLGPRAAIWLSSIIFAILHLHYGIQTIMIVYDGLILAWARYRTGSILVPVLLHMMINGTIIALLLAGIDVG